MEKLNPLVMACSKMVLTGNVVPVKWLRGIRSPRGRADLVAVFLLAELVFWHRLREVRDVKSGKSLGFCKRFSGDYFSRSLSEWADFLAVTVKQVRGAIATLDRLGLVTVERRKCRQSQATLVLLPVPEAVEHMTLTGSSEGVGGYDLQDTESALQDTQSALQGIASDHTAILQSPGRASNRVLSAPAVKVPVSGPESDRTRRRASGFKTPGVVLAQWGPS